MAAPVFGLIDGNSFYCSCERAFDPKLWGRPVIVLSNNDGCAIARTSEAKELGIRMGAPWHLIRGLPAFKQVMAFSSNYALCQRRSKTRPRSGGIMQLRGGVKTSHWAMA